MAGFTLSEIAEAIASQLRNNIEPDTNIAAFPVEVAGTSVTVWPDQQFVTNYWETGTAAGYGKTRWRLRCNPAGEAALEAAWRRLYDFLSVGTGNARSVIDALGASDSSGVRWNLGRAGTLVQVLDVSIPEDSITADVIIEVTVKKTGASA